jgi:hypothetical protein
VLSPTKPLTALLIGLLAMLWFLVLSDRLLVAPGTVVTERFNVLFNTDVPSNLGRMCGARERKFFDAVHPFELAVWRPTCQAIQALLPRDARPIKSTAPTAAEALSGRILLAALAGLGVGSLGLLATATGSTPDRLALLFGMYLLFTSNVVVVLPESYGLSNGILSAAYVAPLFVRQALTQAALCLFGAVAAGGTTLTNGLFSPAWFLLLRCRSRRARLGLGALAVIGAVVALIAVRTLDLPAERYAQHYLQLRLLRDPVGAAGLALSGLVFPAIGPTPVVQYERNISYQPLLETAYSWLSGAGALSFAILLLVSTGLALRHPADRRYAYPLLFWIGLNLVFHNLWGDEFFLYSPHWSWALMGLIILGSRQLRLPILALFIVPIVAGQVSTLLGIYQELLRLNARLLSG